MSHTPSSASSVRAPRLRRATAMLATTAAVAALAVGLLPTAAVAAPGSFATSFEAGDATPALTPVGDAVNVSGGSFAPGSVLPLVTGVTASAENAPGESAARLADANAETKWLAFQTTGWARYALSAPAAIGAYTLTSGNDAPERDPKNFTLSGSVDGTTWVPLDSRSNVTFSGRKVMQRFDLPARTAAYSFFRLDVTANNGSSNIIQLADWDLIDPTAPATTSPLAVTIGAGPTSSDTAKTGVGFDGVKALQYAGRFLAPGAASSSTLLYDDLGLDIADGMQLNYKLFPVLDAGQTYAATFVAVDLVFDDGSQLSTDAVDAYGYPVDAAEQGRANKLWPNQWNSVSVALDDYAGRTLQDVRLVFEHPGTGVTGIETPVADTAFTGWLDDITIDEAPVRDTSDGLVSYVDTRRGTNSTGGFSRGNNIPAAAVPNGFNFITPMTNADNTGSIYHYQRENNAQNRPGLNGIGFSHQPSIWMGDRNQLAVIPAANDNPTSTLADRRLSFSHDNETARPDMYDVTFDNGIETAVTPTDHGAIYRFTFTGDVGSVLVDQVVSSSKLSISGNTLSGWVDGGSGWPGRTRMFVYGTFDSVPKAAGATTVGNRTNTARYAAFDTSGDKTVELRVSSSFLSQEQAQRNHAFELDGVSFEQAHADVMQAWNERLSVVTDVEGASDDQLQTLYSSLYRLNLYPNSQFENTGTEAAPVYRYASPVLPTQGAATDTATNAQIVDGKIYVNNGFWDTYRTAWPLYSLLYPEQTQELVDGFVEQYRNGGWIARWSSPGYADLMTGTSSDVSFAEAYVTGALDNATALEAFDAAVKNATVLPASDAVGRKGLDRSIFLGYTQESTHESASWGLEGFVNDYGIAQMAAALADDPETPDARRAELREQAEYFSARSDHFVEMFNDEAGTFTARNADGTWPVGAEFDKKAWGGAFTEASAWTFGYHAPQNVAGLAALYGGRQGLIDNLHAFLTTREKADYSGIHEAREARDVRLGMLGFSNQVSHHIPYVLAEAGDPAGAQKLIRDIQDRMFVGSDIGQGYPGDEDNGEMSAWYVFSALGFYPLQVGSGDYTIGTPLFDSATLNFGGKSLTVTAPGASEGRTYVAGVSLNGDPIDTTTFDGAALREGGTLAFEMSDTPTTWGAKDLTEDLEVPAVLTDASGPAYGSLTAADGTGVAGLTDDNMRSSATFAGPSADLVWTSRSGPVSVESYTVSATTVEAAPRSWTLSGSVDGTTWQTLDERADQSFMWDNQTRPFTAAETGSFSYYRLQFAGADVPLELDEIELFATSSAQSDLSVTASGDLTVPVDTELAATLATVLGSEESAAGYDVSVDFGDGTPVQDGVLTANGLGGWQVSAPHTFTRAGVYSAAVTVRDSAGGAVQSTTRIEAVRDATLEGAFNVTCIGDLHQTAANCDGQGYGYDRAKLVADGFIQGTTVAIPGTELTFDLPDVEPGAPDNVTGEGQTIALDLGAGATRIAVVGTATELARELDATLTFSDGSTQPLTIGFGDWVGASGSPAFGNTVLAVSEGRLSGTEAEGSVKNTAIYATVPVALATDADGAPKRVVSIELPQEEGTLRDGRAHIFAFASDGDRAATQPLTVTAGEIAEQTEGVAFEGALATVSGGAEETQSALVNWGDGSPVEVREVADGAVTGGHTWATAGEYTVSVTVDDGVRSATASVPVMVGEATVYEPVLTVAPTTARPGDTVTISGTGFAPGEEVEVSVGSDETQTVRASEDAGAFEFDVTIPDDAAEGSYPVVAVGSTSSAEATASIVVTRAPVGPVATRTTLSAAPTEPTAGVAFRLTAEVAPGEAAGQVVFTEGETIVGSATVSGGTAGVEVTATGGVHAYTATFVPDDAALFGGSTSTALSVTVAEAPQPGEVTITLDRSTVRQGESLGVTGAGFAAGEQVEIVLNSDPVLLATVSADGAGVLQASVVIPASTAPGAHEIVVTGLASGGTASAALTVLAANSGNTAGGLPVTGGQLPFIALAGGMLLLGLGAAFLVMRRRRRLAD
jgi:predicted alpha-1,2-mannosidase